MDINDRVYGKITIDEPVLIELINSKPLQRLKGINQAGASQYVLAGKDVTRYEHCLGVMILLKKLGASIEEQIAGLLHDVPHTAFSHVIDFVFKENNHNQEYHEWFHEKIILQSEIPVILEKYGFDVKPILDDSNFPLLEKSLPDLCADRVDYALRDMVADEGFSDKINEYVLSLIVYENEIIFNNESTARKFAEDYLRMNYKIWSNPFEVTLFQILADAIKIAIDEKILTEEDLFSDDEFVYNKLAQSKNESILIKLDMLNTNLKIDEDSDNPDYHLQTKPRFIDPKYQNLDSSINKVRDTFEDYSLVIDKYVKWVTKGYPVKILSWLPIKVLKQKMK